jgi:hypothetical protein
LPDNIDENIIKALLKDGMLNMQNNNTEEIKPKAIEVKVE